MRDGVKLHTRVFVPEKRTQPLPIILNRTPSGVANAERNFVTRLRTLADEGYIFAFQDIRGKYGSGGQFVMQRPARAPGDTKALDEGTDTWDTIEWLLANTSGHNGRVGMMGVSYDGWTTIMGALEPHPALRAISPQASPADMWLGDDFHLALGRSRTRTRATFTAGSRPGTTTSPTPTTTRSGSARRSSPTSAT